jgi:Tol biopolymer transport system component
MTSEGTNVRALAQMLDVRGTACWSPDGNWIVIAADEGKGAHLFKVPTDGGPPLEMLKEPSSNPVWSQDGRLIVYSGTPVGGSQPLKAVTVDGTPVPLPELRVLSSIGNRYRFLPDGKALILLLGGYRQQNFWMIDVATGRQRQLTDLRQSYSLRNFDISPDGKQILFDRVRENSDIVLIELRRESPMKQDSERRP